MPNLVVHFELHATTPQKLIEFYGPLFGWEFTQFGDMPYWMIGTGEGSIGNSEAEPGLGINGGLTERMGPAPKPGKPVSSCNIVVGVEDVDTMFASALELGGTEVDAPADVPGVGRVAGLNDPEGNYFGIMSPVLSDGTLAM